MSAIRAAGAILKDTEQPIDTSTAAGKCFLDMLGVFAEFETNLRRERQLEGIAEAKARGVYKGRKASIDPEKVRKLKAEGMGAYCKGAQDRPRVGVSSTGNGAACDEYEVARRADARRAPAPVSVV